MTPDHYHNVLLALDQALHIFREQTANLSADDRQMLWHLELLRSQVLKAESGHPFPLQTLLPAGRVAESPPAVESSTPVNPDDAAGRPNRIRVLIADDYDTVRLILRAFLAAEPDFDVIAEAKNGQEDVELAGACQPDIIIMDLNMPVLDGIAATRESLRVSPHTRILVFSANREPASVRKSAEAGAVGYICKPANRKMLVTSLRDVHAGKTAFPDDSAVSTTRTP